MDSQKPRPELVEGRGRFVGRKSLATYVYILRCVDGRYYVGSTRGSLEKRVNEHNAGTFGGYTGSRRPVTLVYHESFENVVDAIAMERRIKGWSRAKKEALIHNDFEALKRLARSHSRKAPRPSTRELRSLLRTRIVGKAGHE